jgi:hypothetical protein
MKNKINKINTLNAIAYAIVCTIAYPIGYAKHMFIVYSLYVYSLYVYSLSFNF